MRALAVIEETGEADFPCIRFYESGFGYRYGVQYTRNPHFDTWKVGDRQQ